MLNATDGVEVHLNITKVYRLSLGVRRIAQIFLKPIVEKFVVFRAKMWAQMAKRAVSILSPVMLTFIDLRLRQCFNAVKHFGACILFH